MDYISLDKIPHYSECSQMVSGIGFVLVDLKTIQQKGQYSVQAVITRPAFAENKDEPIGINDCAKVHRLLLPRIEALIGSQDVYMEVMSPGLERNIKNAAEFAVFIGRSIRIWDKEVSCWISGVITASDDKSVAIEISQEDGGVSKKEKRTILFEQIAKAKLLYI